LTVAHEQHAADDTDDCDCNDAHNAYHGDSSRFFCANTLFA